ncbi:MAG: LPS export ABC transporter permease LptF [Rhodospirillaceae bacterium]|nr:LPS export ABC transporter permease LptF [Rhodospirillaceae bacterium]HAA91537.1 LPS export ABC transporter permease LptF [Rhodospirillaceae bacterium]
MKSLGSYISKQIAGVTVFVILILVFAVFLTQSLRIIDWTLNRGLSFNTFLTMAGLQMPFFLVVLFPIAPFASTLFVYSRLITDSELIVMRAAGVGNWALARPGLLVGFVMMVLTFILNLYVQPASFREYKAREFEFRNELASVALQEGIFNDIRKGITVYVRERDKDGQLYGILLHDNRKLNQPETMMAEKGALVDTDQGPRIILVNGIRQTVNYKQNKSPDTLEFDRWTVELPSRQRTGARSREPAERFLNELFFATDDERYKHLRYRAEMFAEGHNRLATGFLPLTFCAMALAILLSGSFNRRGHAILILEAIGTIAFVLVLSLALKNYSVTHQWMLPLMYVNAVLPLLISLYVIVVPRQFPPPRYHRASAASG